MKIINLFTLLLISAFVEAQSYTDFPQSNAIWKDYNYTVGHGPGQTVYNVEQYIYSIDGDTVIGREYKKFKRIGWQYFVIINTSGTTKDSTFSCSYYGGFRTDSLKHVFFLGKTDTTERLLYDFNLNVGDTLPLTVGYNTYQYNTNIVKSIDSILIDSFYRKRYNICTTVDSTIFVSLIEGIGCTAGLFGTLIKPPISSSDYKFALECHYLDNNLVFSQGQESWPIETNCEIYQCQSNGIDDYISSMNSGINVSPNPTRDKLTIETLEKATIEIYNIEGQIIKTINTADKQTSIDVSNLSSGVYIIRAKTERGVAVKKFIKE